MTDRVPEWVHMAEMFGVRRERCKHNVLWAVHCDDCARDAADMRAFLGEVVRLKWERIDREAEALDPDPLTVTEPEPRWPDGEPQRITPVGCWCLASLIGLVVIVTVAWRITRG